MYLKKKFKKFSGDKKNNGASKMCALRHKILSFFLSFTTTVTSQKYHLRLNLLMMLEKLEKKILKKISSYLNLFTFF
jgi:hypothetical protein